MVHIEVGSPCTHVLRDAKLFQIVLALCKQQQEKIVCLLANNESYSKHNLRIAVYSDGYGHKSVKSRCLEISRMAGQVRKIENPETLPKELF